MITDIQNAYDTHGLYVVFIAAVLLLVVVMTVDAIAEVRRERRRAAAAAKLQATLGNIERGLVAERNKGARWVG